MQILQNHLLTGLAGLALASSAAAQDVEVVPAPQVPDPELLAEQQNEPDPMDRPGATMAGEKLGPDAIGPGRTFTMDEIVRLDAERRAREGDAAREVRRMRNGAQGRWRVPSGRSTLFPHSGERYVYNEHGDTSMGIGFGRPVTLDGAWVAAQGGVGSWATGLTAVGFRDGVEVGRTRTFRDVDETPGWFAIGLEEIDRVVFEADSPHSGVGFYALDDLTYTPVGGDRVVLDFEDLDQRATLTGSGYAGLAWETGTGGFQDDVRFVHPPQVPPLIGPVGGGTTTSNSNRGGNGTNPTLVQDFRGPRLGDAGANAIPPDTCGAVGPNHFVAVVNSNISIYDKATGNRQSSSSLTSLFGAGVGDPRVLFDHLSGRWVACATPFNSRIYVAVSATDDPTGSWFSFWFNAAQGVDSGKWVDHPTLGVDGRGIYIGAFMVGGSNTMTLFAIDLAPLLSSPQSAGTVTAFRSLPWEGALQTCSHYQDPGFAYSISRRGTGNQLRVRRINPPLNSPSLTQVGFVSVNNFNSPPNAPALGSSTDLDSIDTRLINAVYAAGSIWTVHCVGGMGRAVSRWYEVDPVALTRAQGGTVNHGTAAGADLYYIMPSIAADNSGNMVMGFTGTNSQIYPSCYYVGRQAGDNSGQVDTPVNYQDGLGPYNFLDGAGRNRWGDYSLTSLDPVDGTFWTIQEYTRPNGNGWVTRVAQLDHGGGPSCGTITRYCSPAVPHQFGTPARIDTSGNPSLADNNLVLLVGSLPGQTFGLFFYGMDRTSAMVGDGILCINNPFYRLPPVQSDIFGAASYQPDWNNLPDPLGQIAAGETWNFSFWYRQVGPAGYNFSDALEIVWCP